MPIYNVEQYLPECIDSIIHQTYRDIDIILVDDGLTDSSGEICDEYARLDPRISVIHKTNGGLSDARNTGLSQSHTKYIYFLDSDDYIEPQAIEILHAVSEQYNLDVLAFDVNEIISDDSDGYTEEYDYWIASGSYPDVMSGADLFTAMFNNKDYKASVPLHFYNREFLAENGLTFMKGIIHEDEHFTLTVLLSAKRAMHIPVRLYDRRIRNASIMTSPITQRNSDGMYVILHEVLHTYGHFRNAPETKAAYGTGTRYIIAAYAQKYAQAFDVQDEKGHSQFREMMSELKSLGYDTSDCERRVRLRHLYDLKSAVGKIPGLKKRVKRCWHVMKRVAKRFIPRLDDRKTRHKPLALAMGI